MKTQKIWKAAAAEILSSRTPENVTRDDERVEIICDILRQSRLGRQILHWADQNGVEIWMDQQCTSVGYYTVGSNTVCLNSNVPDNKLAMCLAHELRHAWQDHEGLLPSGVSTAQNYTAQIRFVEADAFAFGYVIAYEIFGKETLLKENSYLTSQYTSIIDGVVGEDPYALDNGAALCVAFHSYFNNLVTKYQYDERAMGRCARDLNIINETTQDPLKNSFESIDFSSPKQAGINLNDPDDILRLGNLFGVSNYLNYTRNMSLGHNPLYVGQFGQQTKLLLRQIKNIQKQKKRTTNKPQSLSTGALR